MHLVRHEAAPFSLRSCGCGEGLLGGFLDQMPVELLEQAGTADVAFGSRNVSRGVNTVSALADRYLNEHARRFKRSADADERNLRLHILPKWGKRRYDQIERADVIELVEGIVGNGTPVQANRVQALVSKMFSFAVDASLVKFNPCSRLRKRGAETRETRVLTDDEIRQFWRRAVLPPVAVSDWRCG